MNKLHVGNPSGVATQLSKRDNGHVLVNSINAYDYENDYYYKIGNGKIQSFINCIKTLYTELKYDIIHSHSRHVPFSIDLVICRIFGKKIIMHYHGTDIRRKKQPNMHKKLGNYFFVSTPDLLKYVNAEWLPSPIASKCYYVKYKKHCPIKIIHAPTNRKIKGTEHVLNAINNLKKRGYHIDFELIENKPHQYVLNKISACDIVIDWINPNDYNIYGVLSLESMAYSKPVICSYNTEYYNDCPIIHATEHNLEYNIKRVIEMSNEDISDICKRGIEYVNRVHYIGD